MNTLIILIGIVVVIGFFVVLYNRLVALRMITKNAFADVDVQLKQRYDLIPNLVATIKGYAAHESEVFEKVTAARATAMQGGSTQERAVAEGNLSGALMNLMAVAENYPQLKANENFIQMQNELVDLENKIAAARRFYNNAVTEYNTAIQQFPGSLFAAVFAFKSIETFTLGDERQTVTAAPKVSFGN